ncbi:MAG: DUF4375 domain-containing protein [Betaproteobacteria bacterium]|nr:MAG: DUF4375 domain-containing protein [Betaproteobacteria bacterium]
MIDLTPESTEAEKQQHAIESELMAALSDGGRQAGESLVRSLSEHGYELVRVRPCLWRVELPPPRVLELWFNPPKDPIIAALSYRKGTPWGTPSQKRVAERQEAFYARYEKLIPIDDSAVATLSTEDRLIFVIGEFEADINNGGFGQYLDNKGTERAQEALGYLEVIDARRTARWLSSALEAAEDSAALERLDRQFFNKPQDLASLVMRHLTKRSKR